MKSVFTLKTDKSEKRSKNSHIQLNKAMMERFAFMAADPASGTHQSPVFTVYYLDISAKEIKTEKIKKLGTKFGYFSDNEEDQLGNIEDGFGKIVAEFEKWEQGCGYDIFRHEAKIKEFADLLLNRSEMRREQIQAMANYIFLEKYKGDKELLAKYPIEVTPTPLFTNHGVTLLINHTSKNFVIPRNGFYFACPDGRENCFVLPISPKRAIVLYPKSCNFFKSPEVGNPPLAIMDTADEQSISALNNSALLSEKAIDKAFVISKTQAELEELLEFVKSDRWALYRTEDDE